MNFSPPRKTPDSRTFYRKSFKYFYFYGNMKELRMVLLSVALFVFDLMIERLGKMPDAITHYLHGQRVLERLKEKRAPGDLDAFLWGLQGPDFLYYHGYLPGEKENLRDWGRRLHSENAAETIKVLQESWQSKSGDPLLTSYLHGFLCHYSLDRIAHPYVKFCACELLVREPDQGESVLHVQVEASLDVIMLRYELAQLPSDFNLKKCVPKSPSVQAMLAVLYRSLLERRFGETVDRTLLIQAQKDMRMLMGMMNDRTSLKKSLVESWERAKGMPRSLSSHFRGMMESGDFDYANSMQNQWQDGDIVRNESFFTLYENAVDDACTLISEFFSGSNPVGFTKNIPFC